MHISRFGFHPRASRGGGYEAMCYTWVGGCWYDVQLGYTAGRAPAVNQWCGLPMPMVWVAVSCPAALDQAFRT